MLRIPAAACLLAFILTLAQGAAYWCPMHPNERAAAPAPCPVCKMPMVPMPPVKVGEYVMTVDVDAHASGRGASGLQIRLFEPGGHAPVRGLDVVHERPLHFFIIDRALEYFAHLHPAAQADGRFVLPVDLRPGEYMTVADFVPAGGTPQTLQRAIVVTGTAGAEPASVPVLRETPRRQAAAGVAVTLAGGLTVGKTDALTFSFADAATGEAPAGLEPYLGAPAHLLIASADLTDVQHAHPEESAGPIRQVAFDVTPAMAAGYKLWLQFQRNGQIVTVPFVLNVQR